MKKKKLSDTPEKFESARLRMIDAWQYLDRHGKQQKEIAAEIGTTPSNFSQAIGGNPRMLTYNFLQRFADALSDTFNRDWVIKGEGEMLVKSAQDIQDASVSINQSWANHPNAIVNAGNNGNLMVSESGNINNMYGDSPAEERRWCPVIPTSMSKQPDFDIMGHVSKQMGGNFERLYSGTACIDVWHYITDNDLYPYYWKGDCLGLKAYEPNDFRIKTGNVYVVDTKRDGFIVRRFRLNDNGDLESYTFNDTDPQKFIIPKHDVIRVYSVVLMFRY